jgi:glycosyltransferase involved in cell wall biosynthesis
MSLLMNSFKGPSDIMVSVIMIAFNHENYIARAIEGVLIQKTNFKIELIIHDDASTDKTADIIREYEKNNQELFVAIYQTDNQFSKKEKSVWTDLTFPFAKGKYIALCEGDDYWTDPYKLQKQVDFLEENVEYILCTHNHSTLYSERSELTDKVKFNQSFTYDLDFYFKNQITPTLTSCFRNIFRDYSYLAREKMFSDFFLFFELLKHGKGYYMVDNMATYRVHEQGVCSGLSEEQKILNHIIMFKHLYKYNPWISQISHHIARYHLNHFNYTLRINKKRRPEWSDLINYFKYEPGFFRILATFLFFVPFYLFRYWLPNILSFKI